MKSVLPCFYIVFLMSIQTAAFSQSDHAIIDSLIEIISDKTLVSTNPLEVERAIKQITEIEISIAAKAAPQIAMHLDMHRYIQDTMAFLRLQEGYTPTIPFEYLYPAVKTAVYIGEPILPFILFHIAHQEKLSSIYKMNALHVMGQLLESNQELVAYIKKYADRSSDPQKSRLHNLANSIARH